MSPEKHTFHITDPNLKYELWVILCVACVLLLTEIGLRSTESYLSGNLNHIHQIPTIASRFGTDEPSVLFLGNSLTNNAIDPHSFKQPYGILQGQAPDIVEKITPDGTSLSDWYCIYRNFIADQKAAPKVVVMGFAWAQLSDQYPIDPARLGGFFCSTEDIPDLSSTGLSRHDNVLVFMAGAISHVYLNREAIRNRVLDMLVPNYRTVVQTLNNRPDAQPNGNTMPAQQMNYTYDTLRHFSRLVAESGARLVVVAMPVQESYPIDRNLLTLAHEQQITLVDLRDHPQLDRTMFADPIHLNDLGRKRFSAFLASALDTLIADTEFPGRTTP